MSTTSSRGARGSILRSPARGLSLVVALAIGAGCGGGGGGGGAGSTTPAAFRVVSVSPIDNANGVALDVKPVLTFSLPVDPASMTASSVQVSATASGAVSAGLSIVADGTGRSLQVLPTQLLAAGTTYGILVSGTLRATTGETIGGVHSFVFRTVAGMPGGGTTLPTPSALREANGSLALGRRDHTATMLADGKVLVCGGYTAGTTVTDRVERFDPASELFTTLSGRMRQPRAGHTATRLSDGRVLLAGGWYELAPGTLHIAQTAEVYDPTTGTSEDVGSMIVPRADHAALRLPDGRVLVTGGSELVGDFLSDHASAEVYDPDTRTFSPWPRAMSHTRATHAMVDLLDGRWFLVGGSDVDVRPETFDVATGTFTPMLPAVPDRARFGVAVARFSSGDVAVVGGEGVGEVLHFDRASTTLLNTGSGTNRPRAYATATEVAPGQVLVAGGIDYGDRGLVLASCDLVVEGGVFGSATYATTVRFPTGMADHTATRLGDGRVLFVGGLGAGGGPALSAAYVYRNP